MKSTTLVTARSEFAEAWLDWRRQPMAVAYMGGESGDVADFAERIRNSSSDLCDRKAWRYIWFIESAGELAGMVALTSVNWRMGHAEITYMVEQRLQRRGIATAAVSLLIDRVFDQTDLHRLLASVTAGHEASIGVLRKLGFEREGCLREHYLIQGQFVDRLLFGLLRREWRNNSRSCAT